MERRRGWRTESPVSALAFVGGSRLLAVAGKAVEFWDTQTERPKLSDSGGGNKGDSA